MSTAEARDVLTLIMDQYADIDAEEFEEIGLQHSGLVYRTLYDYVRREWDAHPWTDDEAADCAEWLEQLEQNAVRN